MPVPPSSAASARTNPVTPALAAQYAASIGRPRVAAAEATAMNRPRRGSGRSSRAGTATRARFSTPPRSTSSTACSCPGGTCQAGTPPAMTPAAAIAASRPPQRSPASRTAAASASGSRTSASTAATAAGSGAAAATRSSSARVPSRYGSAGSSVPRSTATTRHPFAASAATVAAPMPRAAPGTSATRPVTATDKSGSPLLLLDGESRVGSGSGTEAGQRILVAGPIRSGANGDRHRPGTVRMIAERPGYGRPGDGRERPLAVSLDALRVGAVQRQPGEELGRHAPAAARVVGRTRPAGAPGLRPAQPGEQLGIPPHRGEAAGAADVPGQEVLVDGERARVDVTDRVDQADHAPRAAQVRPGSGSP